MTESGMAANVSLHESTNAKMWQNRNVDI